MQQQANRCQGLYDLLLRYEKKQPIHDSEGKLIIISEEMREAKISELKEELDQFCR